MALTITAITTPFILNVSVNCYLVRTDEDFVLIDSGRRQNLAVIESEIERAGCRAGLLKLIVLTHGDFDHCGNAAYLRIRFGSKIAMHADDRGMVERGDMFWNRQPPNPLLKGLFGLMFSLSEADRFEADCFIRAGDSLGPLGFDAEVIEIPGHSKGSIGLLARDGSLFCGDLLANTARPDLWSIMDDKAAAAHSVETLMSYEIGTVYPGHGKPFPFQAFLEHYQT